MDRKHFLRLTAATGGALWSGIIPVSGEPPGSSRKGREFRADLVIAGGGLGGCAAALAALRNGLKVILTEETDWMGGQSSQQGVPPDEHPWIEEYGCTASYRNFRNQIRNWYRKNRPLTAQALAEKQLNPGGGIVSRLCHEPRVAREVLTELLQPYLNDKRLLLFLEHRITGADTDGDRVMALTAVSIKSGTQVTLTAPWFIDATETGELLPLTGTEHVTGTESRSDTRELHAPEQADPENNQAFTVCFAMDHLPGENHLIEKPQEYDLWRNYIPAITPPWPGKLLDFAYSYPPDLTPRELAFDPEGAGIPGKLNLWLYRRILDLTKFRAGSFRSDITLVNWPQNDYMEGNIIGVSQPEFEKQVNRAKQLSLSLLYWLQTEAPRPDKGYGWPGLRLRKDVMGTEDGLAKYPYVRESRRILPQFRILEEHVGKENRERVTGKGQTFGAPFADSVGIGYYRIDLHPTNKGNNYIDFESLPFQIPLGALIPVRMKNLLAACKNIGTTHITNGCYRLHPVEWNIGEAAGLLVVFARKKKTEPGKVGKNPQWLYDFQEGIRKQGVETHWPGQLS